MGRAPRGSEAGYETRLNVIRLEMINGDGKDALASPLNPFLFDVFLFFLSFFSLLFTGRMYEYWVGFGIGF